MHDQDIIVIRHMLRTLDKLGPTGVEARALQEQAELAAGIPLTTTEKDLAVKTILDRGWAATYRDPLTQRIRHYLTEQGRIALAGL